MAYRIKILEIVAQARPDIFPNNEKYFQKIMPVVHNNIPGYYAINWVNPEGVIKWIHPSDGNQSALGKNILERKEVRQYLLDSKNTKLPTISHVIDLYQGPKGLILYVPIFDRGVFKGWYNGVINITDVFDRFFERRKLHNISVTVKWKGHKNFAYNYGQGANEKSELKFESAVLNQILQVSVDLNRGSSLESRKDRLTKVFSMVYISIGLIA